MNKLPVIAACWWSLSWLATPVQAAPSSQILPEQMPAELGAARIESRQSFLRLAHIGRERGSSNSRDVELIKFVVDVKPGSQPLVYWINTNHIDKHPMFMKEVGIPFEMGAGRGGRTADSGRADSGRADGEKSGRGGKEGRSGKGEGRNGDRQQASRGERGSPVLQGRGNGRDIKVLSDYDPASTRVALRADMSYLADVTAPNGSKGLYTYNLEPRVSPELAAVVHQAILNTLPIANGKLAYRVGESSYRQQRQAFAQQGVDLYTDAETFIALNTGKAIGVLRYLNAEGLPAANDIVIAKTLPNELPRVAGVITAVRQTPLSHVNLRAVQDRIPNAYIDDVLEQDAIQDLIGKYVVFNVSADGYELRAASQQEVQSLVKQPQAGQAPVLARDLSLKKILPLQQLGFADSSRIGAKAANVAALKHLGLPEGTVPDGFAVPFYFYDEFMRSNGLYKAVDELLGDRELVANKAELDLALKALRKRIKKADVPTDMLAALQQVHDSFPVGTSLRCRSSTNNEDLPQFSGAGLYDSYTHHPHEGHLAKSIKQVYASLWNFRAFEARERYGVDHHQIAMGVLIHPNFKGELANGVAVTRDVLYGSNDNYYVNAQHGEDLVTNPEAQSTPEELLLASRKGEGFRLLEAASDNRVVLEDAELELLRQDMARIHQGFAALYHPAKDQPFAMEIEFKITKDSELVIKQARPWIY